MNWDEKAKRAAAPQCQLHKDCDHLMWDSMNRPDTFANGARWQRDQLRTDEAVEMVARALVGVTFSAEEPAELEKLKDSRWDAFEEDARAAITALIGEE
ncbi:MULTISPECIES: hypothetical protein [unclassified Brevibacterium]|uniref:hypothetical protein n=1 Tax=unclassified Brevibacterium TaxID=2614124 RepID=UPI001E414912|nr:MULTISPECIES: hypothetical protein [unclassified Brevibacterium]MCD1286502.1 hypothetical protein [Brevibacterium sp. CCUG 69071]MDK8434265.1 hypothetical protein [Brevibacterium sp. H-BE7]